MTRQICGVFLTLLVLALTACGGEPATPTPLAANLTTTGVASSASPAATAGGADDRVPAARQFVTQLGSGDFAGAEQTFDPTMKGVMPEAKLKDTWQQLLAQVGAFQGLDGARTTQATQQGQQYDVVFVTTVFAKATLETRVVFNSQGQIAGLFFGPRATPAPEATAPPASYVNPAAFQEQDVQIKSGDWTLPGTLSIPQGSGPFPAVVLVHGSGPNDRDETIGPNKPFRDLAGGLASQGIAVLRYDKRTKVDPAKAVAILNLTVKEEVMDDADAAVALLRQTPNIDPNRVFVLGHSLGGMLAPRIAAVEPNIAGLILLAGTTRPLEDTIVEQYTYLFSLDGTPTPDQQKQLDQIKQQAARVKDPALTPATPATDLPLSIPASYWLDLRTYHPAEVAKSLAQPMLILQGERDYQVTMADFQGWKDALDGQDRVTFKTYPALNHLFLPGQGQSRPEEYDVPGHVDPAVVGDIAAWVKNLPATKSP